MLKWFAKLWKRFAFGKSPTFNWNNQKGNFASNSVQAEAAMVLSLAELMGYFDLKVDILIPLQTVVKTKSEDKVSRCYFQIQLLKLKLHL